MRFALAFLFSLILSFGQAQVFSSSLNKDLDNIDSLVDYLRTFEQLGVKHTGSPAAEQTKNWIASKYQQYGYTNISIDSFKDGAHTVRNIVIDDTNASTEKYLIVCAHYDTRNGPGTNDNGSGTVALLATAKLLAKMPKQLRIKYIHFDAEEPGLIGSKHYVNRYLSSFDENLYAVFNVDQIGGLAGHADNDKIKCERDENPVPFANNALSAALTDTLVRVVNAYTNLTGVVTNAFLSDYIPFEEKGYTITGLYQYPPGSTHNHSAADTLGNMDTVSFLQATRVVAAATAYFAKVDYVLNKHQIQANHVVFPNPTKGEVHVPINWINSHIDIIASNGRLIGTVEAGSDKLQLNVLQPGVYYLRATQNNAVLGQTRIVLLPN